MKPKTASYDLIQRVRAKEPGAWEALWKLECVYLSSVVGETFAYLEELQYWGENLTQIAGAEMRQAVDDYDPELHGDFETFLEKYVSTALDRERRVRMNRLFRKLNTLLPDKDPIPRLMRARLMRRLDGVTLPGGMEEVVEGARLRELLRLDGVTLPEEVVGWKVLKKSMRLGVRGFEILDTFEVPDFPLKQLDLKQVLYPGIWDSVESRTGWYRGRFEESSYRLDYYNRPYPNGYHIYATKYAAWVSLHWVAQLVPRMPVLKYTIRRVRLRRLVAAGYEQQDIREAACPVWVGQEILIEPTAVERFKRFLRKWLVRLLRLLPV